MLALWLALYVCIHTAIAANIFLFVAGTHFVDAFGALIIIVGVSIDGRCSM